MKVIKAVFLQGVFRTDREETKSYAFLSFAQVDKEKVAPFPEALNQKGYHFLC